MSESKVLVKFGESCRVISFPSSHHYDNDSAALENEIKKSYSADIPANARLILHLKDEEWNGGEFIDINPEKRMPNKSIVKAVMIGKIYEPLGNKAVSCMDNGDEMNSADTEDILQLMVNNKLFLPLNFVKNVCHNVGISKEKRTYFLKEFEKKQTNG